MKRKSIVFVFCLMLIFTAAFAVSADAPTVAADICKDTTVSGEGYNRFHFLFDGDIDTYKKSDGNTTVTLENAGGIGSLYLLFNLEYGQYTVTDNVSGSMITAGQYNFLHEYINLENAFGHCPTSVTLHFKNGAVRLSEIYVFSSGKAPDYVQVWQPPLEGKTDLLLLSTHGDDDQLFFAGLFPLYAKERGYGVQVAYLTDHRNITYKRTHEMLNGLWETGVTAYPVFGSFKDFRIDSKEGTYQEYARQGVSQSDLMEFVVTQLRRFKPQVVVGHDINGEYGHGMHMVYTDLLINAQDIVNDPAQFPESAEKYGVWDVPKTYLHLYKENPIVVDYDTPLDSWDGLTAFQATQKFGYPCHKSQQYTDFTQWLNGYNNEITKASQIYSNNPTKFGLFRSTVGADVQKNDFMENIVSYAEQARLEAERLEQERFEAAQKEEERLEAERKEMERLEAERIEKEQQEQTQARKEAILFASAGILAVIAIVLIFICVKKKRRNVAP